MAGRVTTPGGLVKITVQVTPMQLEELDERTGPYGSRSDLVRRYVDQGLERDRRPSEEITPEAVVEAVV